MRNSPEKDRQRTARRRGRSREVSFRQRSAAQLGGSVLSQTFITGDGRCLSGRETDQAGTEMLIRTGRGRLCVSPALTDGDFEHARRVCETLQRQGYRPVEQPVSRLDHAWTMMEFMASDLQFRVSWDIYGLGIPLASSLVLAGVKSARCRRELVMFLRTIDCQITPPVWRMVLPSCARS